jgi:hypothetical protein
MKKYSFFSLTPIDCYTDPILPGVQAQGSGGGKRRERVNKQRRGGRGGRATAGQGAVEAMAAKGRRRGSGGSGAGWRGGGGGMLVRGGPRNRCSWRGQRPTILQYYSSNAVHSRRQVTKKPGEKRNTSYKDRTNDQKRLYQQELTH